MKRKVGHQAQHLIPEFVLGSGYPEPHLGRVGKLAERDAHCSGEQERVHHRFAVQDARGDGEGQPHYFLLHVGQIVVAARLKFFERAACQWLLAAATRAACSPRSLFRPSSRASVRAASMASSKSRARSRELDLKFGDASCRASSTFARVAAILIHWFGRGEARGNDGTVISMGANGDGCASSLCLTSSI